MRSRRKHAYRRARHAAVREEATSRPTAPDIVECAACEVLFEQTTHNQRYCSRDCSKAAYATVTKVVWTCWLCDAKFVGTEIIRRCLFGCRRERPAHLDNRLVYVIQMGSGPIKIGMTSDPEGRLRLLQVASPYPLRLIATASGGTTLEARLHRKFAAHRLEGEWFDLQPAEVLPFLPGYRMAA